VGTGFLWLVLSPLTDGPVYVKCCRKLNSVRRLMREFVVRIRLLTEFLLAVPFLATLIVLDPESYALTLGDSERSILRRISKYRRPRRFSIFRTVFVDSHLGAAASTKPRGD
jgi:hypothetical protein